MAVYSIVDRQDSTSLHCPQTGVPSASHSYPRFFVLDTPLYMTHYPDLVSQVALLLYNYTNYLLTSSVRSYGKISNRDPVVLTSLSLGQYDNHSLNTQGVSLRFSRKTERSKLIFSSCPAPTRLQFNAVNSLFF